jgi:hypothetical protein
MLYFTALKIGEKRVRAAQELLNSYAGHALPALALKDNKDNIWEPVGEENLIAVKKETNGYLIAICDKNGIAKSISQWFTEEDKNNIISRIKMDVKLEEHCGKLSLPV